MFDYRPALEELVYVSFQTLILRRERCYLMWNYCIIKHRIRFTKSNGKTNNDVLRPELYGTWSCLEVYRPKF
jgi:hypothetical protein